MKQFLKSVKNKRILITTHDIVDIDGLASCFTLKFFLINKIKNQGVSIYFSELSKRTQNFLNKFSQKYPDFPIYYLNTIDLSSFNIILILDANNLNQINLGNNKDIKDSGIPYIFIDHHYMNNKSLMSSLNLIFDKYSSTAEIVFELIKFYRISLTNPIRTLLISAIITDSGFFKHGNNKTIHNISKLMDKDILLQDINFLLKKEIDISEKIAKIKAMQRVELIKKGEFLIGVTNVSSYGASVASTLIRLGCDIAIVYTKEKNQYRINTRAKKLVCIETGLNLAKILEEFSDKYNGNGGGHDGAAALEVDSESGFNINLIIERVKDYL
ncbi:MAG: bifunctional oligoribonuclease/PAP phosphatase NrnA [Promethearchaeota archaeon]